MNSVAEATHAWETTPNDVTWAALQKAKDTEARAKAEAELAERKAADKARAKAEAEHSELCVKASREAFERDTAPIVDECVELTMQLVALIDRLEAVREEQARGARTAAIVARDLGRTSPSTPQPLNEAAAVGVVARSRCA